MIQEDVPMASTLDLASILVEVGHVISDMCWSWCVKGSQD